MGGALRPLTPPSRGRRETQGSRGAWLRGQGSGAAAPRRAEACRASVLGRAGPLPVSWAQSGDMRTCSWEAEASALGPSCVSVLSSGSSQTKQRPGLGYEHQGRMMGWGAHGPSVCPQIGEDNCLGLEWVRGSGPAPGTVTPPLGDSQAKSESVHSAPIYQRTECDRLTSYGSL